MSDAVKFSTMPSALYPELTDQFPILRPGSPNPNMKISFGDMFKVPVNVDLSTSKKLLSTAEDVIFNTNNQQLNVSETNFVQVSNNTASLIVGFLQDSQEGHEVTLYMTSDVASARVTPINARGFTSITFQNSGDTCKLLFKGGAWNVLSRNGTV